LGHEADHRDSVFSVQGIRRGDLRCDAIPVLPDPARVPFAQKLAEIQFLVRLLTFVQPWKLTRATIPEGPYMIIANHTSYFDIFLLYSMLPNHRFLFMGKGEILSYPLVKTFFKRLNIPVHRNDRLKAAKSFIQAKQAIGEGWSIVIFPEGGIPDGDRPEMVPFKDGAFKLAKSAGVPIVPITFVDNYHLFSDPGHIFGPAHPGISRVYMHPVISKEEVAASTEKELSKKTFEVISRPLIERGLMTGQHADTSAEQADC
jgi:1-acyl-sn-glycerol-3-phosphate acyltransferase